MFLDPELRAIWNQRQGDDDEKAGCLDYFGAPLIGKFRVPVILIIDLFVHLILGCVLGSYYFSTRRGCGIWNVLSFHQPTTLWSAMQVSDTSHLRVVLIGRGAQRSRIIQSFSSSSAW
jgi:hypothetical protein